MSGSSLGVGPPLASMSHTAPALGATPHSRVQPAAQAAFEATLAGSPAPVASAAPAAWLDENAASRMASLAPHASQLPVASGPQWSGHTLATTDVSMAGWSTTAPQAASRTAATSDQAAAIVPVTSVSLSRANAHLSSFV